MTLTLLKNLARSLAVLLVVTFATFTLMFGNGEGIARAVLGLNARPEDVQREVVTLGLDQPLLVQYWHWLRDAVTGNLGESFYTGQSVTDALSSRVPVTLAIVLITLLLTVLLSVLLGVTAAVKGGWVDRLLQFLTVLGTAIPSFIIAIVLVFTFAVAWRVLPATGYVTPEISVSGWAKSVTLPVLALLVGAVASAAAQFRTAVLDTLGLLGGAVFIEQVFALPGMGQLANQSAQVNDVPMVMGTVLVTIVIVLVVNFLGDLATTVLNPKARIR